MKKVQKLLIQSGSMVVCINGVLWGMNSARGGEPNTAQLLFRVGVFLFGLMLLGAGGIVALINKFDRSVKSGADDPADVNDEELFD